MTIKIRRPRVQVALGLREMLAIARRFLAYARPHRIAFAIGMGATVVLNAASVTQPYILKVLTDSALVGPDLSFTALHLCLLALVGTAVIKGLFLYLQSRTMALGCQATIRDLRDDVYRHLQLLPLTWFDQARLGDIVVRFTDDVRLVTEMLADGVLVLLNDSLVIAGSIAYMGYTSPTMTLLAFSLTPVTAWLIDRSDRTIEQSIVSTQGKVSDLTSQLQEVFSGIAVVKAFGCEDEEARHYASSSRTLHGTSLEIARTMLMQGPVIEVISALNVIIVLGYGAWAVSRGALTLGDFVSFWTCLGMASAPIGRLTNTLANLRRGLVAANRIFEIRDIAPEVHEAPCAPPLPEVRREIQVHDVTFGYDPERPVLRNLGFTVPYGKVVAIVGPNGAGKSTLVALLSRLYDPQGGVIRFDGVDVRDVRLRSLRRQIAFVLQHTFLFSGTFRDNLKYGSPEATDEEMRGAARVAHCHELIESLPGGYDARLAEGGRGLSHGQRQRIAIARALVANPRVLVLDEATASLDAQAEQEVQSGLHALMKGRSVFVIAHRLNTVRRADLILVMDNGRIVESGTHEELLASSGPYRQLHRSFYDTGD